MLILLYIIAAVGSFVELIAFRLLIKRPKAEYILFLTVCLIATLGYLAVSVSTSTPEAVLANKLTYLGGMFLPYFMLLTIADFCRTKLPTWLKLFLFLYSAVTLFLVLTIGYSTIYYRHVALGKYYGVTYLWKSYGPTHIMFPILLYVELILSVIVVLRAIGTQKDVTRRTTIMLLGCLFFSMTTYITERILGIPIELMAFSYVVFGFFFIHLAARIQVYDINYNLEEVFGHSMDNGYIAFNMDFCLMNFNSRAAEYFNELKKMQRGSNVYEDSSGVNRCIVKWLKSLEGSKFFPVSTTFDHNDKNFKCNANRLKGLGGRKYGYMVEIIDDTVSQQYIRLLSNYNKALEESVENAEKADKAKSRFLAQMSHEIRTPINVILGMNEMTLREAHDEDILEYSDNIRTAGRTLLALINSILDFSKIEDGKMDIVEVDYDTADMMNSLIIMTSERASEKGLNFETEIPPELPSVLHGDDVRVRQVVTNILTNAVKYTAEGQVTFRVSVKDSDGKKVRLLFEVEDTGIGIREEDRERLFASFERLDEERNRNIEGTGLGISIVQKLLEMMGSSLQVESTYGEGSRFYFELEQGIADNKPMGALSGRDRTEAHRSPADERYVYAPEAKILLVDDNRMNLMVARGLFKRNSVKLTLAEGGYKALEFVMQNDYDIIYMDHLMPGLDGIETMKRMRKEGLIKGNTKVIMMTANAIVGAKEQYLKLGFDGYLSKPVNVEDLEKSLAEYLPESKISYRTRDEEEKRVKNTQEGDGDAIPEEFKKSFEELSDEESMILIDKDRGLQYAKGDETFYKEMLELYVELRQERIEALKTAYENKNAKDYVIAVHDLKSNSRLIGAMNFADFVQELESAGKREDFGFIGEQQDKLMSTFDKIIEEIGKLW